MKKHHHRLVLHRETVLCLQTLAQPAAAALAVNPIQPVTTNPQTSPLCVSTCCGSCVCPF